jgi:hypothetical protein
MIRESEEQDEPYDRDGPTRPDASNRALGSIRLASKDVRKNEQREFLERGNDNG